jgi:hypothetical protein
MRAAAVVVGIHAWVDFPPDSIDLPPTSSGSAPGKKEQGMTTECQRGSEPF